MEQRLWRETSENLTTNLTTTTATATATTAKTTISLQTLSTIHSLITNPTTTTTTLTTIYSTLTTLLPLSQPLNPQTHLHILSLLSTLTHHHPSLPFPTADLISLSTSPTSSPRLAAAALSLLLSHAPLSFSIDDADIISLPFRPCIATRVWFLSNAFRLEIRPNLLVTVFLGFTKDPYPIVRQAALIGLARAAEDGVVVEDSDIVEACYFRAVELLTDRQDCVRPAAVRVVGEWGRMLAALKQGDQRDWSDAVFLQICSAVRDMTVGVRVEVFSALGKFAFVSEYILSQSLSKKVLAAVKEKQPIVPLTERHYQINPACAAGVFIHGLEDEYSEVQRAACITLRMLPVVSGQFGSEAVNILSYILNDDSIVVRLEALKTMLHMTESGCSKMQEESIDVLLGTLVDSNRQIRSMVSNVLGFVKLANLKLFKLTVESLMRSLELYPQSEAELFRTFFTMGRKHGNYAVSIIEENFHEIAPSGDEKFGLNNHRIAGLLVLAISASLNNEKCLLQIPQRVFTYAPAFFGQISRALRDDLDTDFLLRHLTQCGSRSSQEQPVSVAQKGAISALQVQQLSAETVLNALKLILSLVKSSWSLVKTGNTNEMLKTLRYCKESLQTLRDCSVECAGAVAFAFHYIRIVKVISKVWECFVASRKSQYQMGELDILLSKLDQELLALRFRFSGLEEEDELYILELILVSYVLSLSSFHLHSKSLHRLSTTIAHIDIIKSSKSLAFSDFVNQLAEFSKRSLSNEKPPCNPSDMKRFRDIFILKDLTINQKIKHVSAELLVTGFDSVTPLRFISGLPAGVPLEITLYNVRSEHILWVKVTTTDKLTEFIFLDMEESGGPEEVKQVKITVPFYRTPNAAAFSLRVSIGMECISENLHLVKGYGGPKHALTYISPEIDVYFVNKNTNYFC